MESLICTSYRLFDLYKLILTPSFSTPSLFAYCMELTSGSLKLEDVASSLQQLWISYNSIASLDGLACLTNLTTLYCSNNLIKSFAELDKLKANEQLRDVLFIGNPMYSEVAIREEARIEILRHLPNLKKIDGEFVKPSELETAQKVVEEDN